MRRWPLVVFAFLTLWMVGDHPVSAQNAADNCPPRYRKDPVATARARDAKKAQMRQRGFPERFLSLLDREECVACVETASDGFHIMVVYNDDENAPKAANGRRWTSHSFGWDPQSERQVRDQLAAGKIKAFYIMNTATRCDCCPEVSDDSRTNESYADWNAELEVHMSHVITFDEPSDLGPLPPDLENPPAGWINDVPDIEQFTKPPHRQVHVMCPACEDLEAKVNSAYDTLDFLWSQKINMLEGISITENAIGQRENQISRMEYQQLFSTRTDARQKQIDELTEVNRQQRDGLATTGRKLAELDRQIAETNAGLARLMKLLLDCENRCKTTTATQPVVANTPPGVAAPPAAGQATCTACNAAAAEVGRLNGEIQARAAELARLGESQRINDANLNNLEALRAGAASRADNGARVAELEGRIAELQAANEALRAQEFSVQEEIQSLNEAVAKARRDLEACNSKCAETMPGSVIGTDAATGRRPRSVVVPPLTMAACPACADAASALQAAHAALQKLAQRANDLQIDSDFAEFEEQRVRVERLQQQLEACNRKCTTATTGTTTTTGTTLGGPTTIGPTGTALSTAPALCPDCAAVASEAARINGEIQARNAELNELRNAQNGNSANLNNLVELRAEAARRNNPAQVADYEQRISDLQAANKANRAQQFAVQEAIAALTEALARLARQVDACNSRCAGTSRDLPTNTVPGTGGGRAKRTVAVPPLTDPACPACGALADALRAAHRGLQELAERANAAQRDDDFEQFEEQRVRVEQLRQQLEACNQKCTTATAANPPPATTPAALVTGGAVATATPATKPVTTTPPAACFGSTCSDDWNACSASGSCAPVATDCGIPGSCEPPCGAGDTCLDPTNESSWTCDGCDADPGFQLKQVDLIDPASHPLYLSPQRIDYESFKANVSPNGITPVLPANPGYLVIPPVAPPQVRQWFNPLGLLARTVLDAVSRWRGSIGPMPLINPRDLKAIERYSGGQAAGLPRGVHMLLTDAGGSTGKTLTLQILNLSGKPVRLSSLPFAVEPIKQQAQQRVQQSFNRLAKAAPARLELSAYCLELLKAPPRPGTILRLAPKAVQQKFSSMSKVLQSAYRVQHAGLLRPDSNPAAYTDSIKQWAVWTVEQKFNQARFLEAFAAHTRKNVEAAGQQWTRQTEDVVRKVSPNRWQDIVKVLAGAGMQPSS